MKERPIIFSGYSVQAILAGRKSQTRRLVKPQPSPAHHYSDERRCPYGVPGDRLWVRESFYCDHFEYPHADREEMLEMISYRAGHDCRDWEDGCPCSSDGRSWWRSPLHMPRWASRITLEVTGVRVERLQNITEADAMAEGADTNPIKIKINGELADFYPMNHRIAFSVHWNIINGKRSPWDSNPLVWVVSFKD